MTIDSPPKTPSNRYGLNIFLGVLTIGDHPESPVFMRVGGVLQVRLLSSKLLESGDNYLDARRGGFTAKSIDVTDSLAAELKKIIAATLQCRTEIDDYSLLAQPNEVSCLHVGVDETSFLDLKSLVDEPAEENRIEGERAFRGIAGYLIRIRVGARVMYCVRQVTDAWKTRKARTVVGPAKFQIASSSDCEEVVGGSARGRRERDCAAWTER